jgi:Glycosyl transferase family 2
VKPGRGEVKAWELGIEGPEATPSPAARGSAPAMSWRPVAALPTRPKRWSCYLYRVIAAEVSRFTRYFDRLVQWEPPPHDPRVLFDAIECPAKSTARTLDDLADLSAERERRTAVLLNGNFNYDLDIQVTLMRLRPKLSRTSRLVVVTYNPYLRWLYALADALGLRNSPPTVTFLTRADLDAVTRLAGYEVVRLRPVGYSPFRFLGLGHLLNWWMPVLPGLRWASFVVVAVLRPVIRETRRPSLSIVIPARNERGNIENALKRMPDLGTERLEIVFVEGHSTDDTWAEIRRVAERYRGRFDIKTLQQTGKGKCDAVRLGFQHCTGELLAILDADLTMPPELLGRFYDAYCQGLADFVNGSRLLYPMEGEAMPFPNHLGNVFFAKALSFVLGTRLSDSLCGTKLLARHDYRRFAAWRSNFGDFDPFGDYELLFPASMFALGIIDVPIRYRARTYGATNINRFRDGWMLLKMTLLGLFRVRVGPWRTAYAVHCHPRGVQPSRTDLIR